MQMVDKDHVTFYTLLLIVLASNSFFQFKPLQEHDSIMKFAYYFFILVAILFACILSLNKQNGLRNFLIKKQPVGLVLSLFVVTLLSVYNSFIYKDQPLSIGLMTSLQTLSVYFIFFAVAGLGLSVRQFEKLIVCFGITYVFILSISYFTLPNPIFGTFAIEEGRGGVRFRLPGYFWTVALYFYSIQQYRDKGDKLFLAFIVLCLFATLLTFARQYLAYSVVLGFIFYVSGISLRRKLYIIVLVILLSIFVVPNTKLYQNYSSLTKEQLERNKFEEEDVRVKDYRVFLFDYPRSTMQYLFGCGLGSYGNSEYGNELEKMDKIDCLIPVDTGWAGFVFYYGYIGVALLLFVIFKSLFLKCPKRYYYLKFIILYMSLCSVLGGTILFNYEYLIIFLAVYMLFRVSSLRNISELMTSLLCIFILLSIDKKFRKKINIYV